MPQLILVTSFKGGVGKTTLSANLAASLAARSKNVLVCDCDLESRCLDLVLGVENQPLFNICDAVDGRCEAADAICKHERVPRLYFMPAPAFYPEAVGSKQTDEVFTPDAVKAFLGAIAALPEKIDTVVCDLPARPDGLYRSLVPSADKIIVVSMHNAVSIRAAEKTGIALHELCTGTKKPEVFLAVNGFVPQRAARGENAGLYDILTQTKLPLIGVLPYDEAMAAAQNRGLLACEISHGETPFGRAVENLTRRLEGENVRLLEGIRTGVPRRKLF